MTREEMTRLVRRARVGRLATIDPSQRPHLVPLCFALEGDTLYSAVDQKPKASTRLQRLRNIEVNPQAVVLVDHYDEDWATLWWVRLRGRARMLTGAERERALELLIEKYEQYAGDPPTGPVIAIDVDEWRAWSAVVNSDPQ
jgi:PPOX class probable F420-dependent enzyme